MQSKPVFSLIGHPPNTSLLHDYMVFQKPTYAKKAMNDELLRSVFSWTPAFKAFDIKAKQSGVEKQVDGIFVLATFFPDMLLKKREKVVSKIKEAIQVSEKHGVKIAALGGFTSIADGKQGAEVAKTAGSMSVTNGNTMTSALAIEGINKISKNLAIDLSTTKMAIIGATGNIGKTCARYFTGRTKKLILTARNIKKLEKEFSPAKDRNNKQIELSINNKATVSKADFVICVTSSSESLFTPDIFKKGAVICDVGYPKTVSGDCAQRSDIIVYIGGIAEIPHSISEAKLWGLGSSKYVFGCFAEAMTIAMEGCYELATVGANEIAFESLKKMHNLGRKHGFKVAPFFNSKTTYTKDNLQYIKSIR